MNQLLLAAVALVLFIHFGGSNVPKILKDNKRMIYGVTIVLVLCSFFSNNVEGGPKGKKKKGKKKKGKKKKGNTSIDADTAERCWNLDTYDSAVCGGTGLQPCWDLSGDNTFDCTEFASCGVDCAEMTNRPELGPVCAKQIFEYVPFGSIVPIPEKTPLTANQLDQFHPGDKFSIRCNSPLMIADVGAAGVGCSVGETPPCQRVWRGGRYHQDENGEQIHGDFLYAAYVGTAGAVADVDTDETIPEGYIKVEFNRDMDGQLLSEQYLSELPELALTGDGKSLTAYVEPNNLIPLGHTFTRNTGNHGRPSQLDTFCTGYLVGARIPQQPGGDDVYRLSVAVADLVDDKEFLMARIYDKDQWEDGDTGCEYSEKLFGRWTSDTTFSAHTLGLVGWSTTDTPICDGWDGGYIPTGNITFTFNYEEQSASVTLDAYDPPFTFPLNCQPQPPIPAPRPIIIDGDDGH